MTWRLTTPNSNARLVTKFVCLANARKGTSMRYGLTLAALRALNAGQYLAPT